MEKQQIFLQVSLMKERISDLDNGLKELKEQLAFLVEENHYLKLENEHLRKRLEKDEAEALKKGKEKKTKATVGEGYDNLARIYQEGFHVCSVQFGSIRSEENCLFCLSLLHQK